MFTYIADIIYVNGMAQTSCIYSHKDRMKQVGTVGEAA